MRVVVMEVWRVVVLVLHALVAVRVRVFSVKWWVVDVVMVTVVVAVGVVVVQRFVQVLVLVALGQVQPQAAQEAQRRHRRAARVSSIAQRPANRGANERRDGEDRARAGRAH
jgi:hypothetical protein